jgi:hypothetical protein
MGVIRIRRSAIATNRVDRTVIEYEEPFFCGFAALSVFGYRLIARGAPCVQSPTTRRQPQPTDNRQRGEAAVHNL